MKKSPTFRINPNFRLQSNYLHVAWYRVDAHTLQTEIAFAVPARQVFNKNKGCYDGGEGCQCLDICLCGHHRLG